MMVKPSVTELLTKTSNRYELVIATSKRARQISSGAQVKTKVKEESAVTLAANEIAEGKVADIVVFDPSIEYVIDRETFFSKGKNTPFHGRKVKGDVRYTLVDGNVVYERK